MSREVISNTSSPVPLLAGAIAATSAAADELPTLRTRF